jgi:hypothetical protein
MEHTMKRVLLAVFALLLTSVSYAANYTYQSIANTPRILVKIDRDTQRIVDLIDSTGKPVLLMVDPGNVLITGGTINNVTQLESDGTYSLNDKLLSSATAPTVASGFGGTASIASSNGTATFRVLTGGTTGNTGVLTMPAAAAGWNCTATLLWVTAQVNQWRQVSSTTTSVTFQNLTISTGAALTAISGQTVVMQCVAY